MKSIRKRYLLTIGSAFILCLAVACFCCANNSAVLLIASISIFLLYLLPLLASGVYFKTLADKPENVARFYMIYLLVKFVYSAVIIGAGNFLIEGSARKTLVLLLAVIFIVSLIVESYLFIQIEKKISHNETNL
jgi:hypothetical protein